MMSSRRTGFTLTRFASINDFSIETALSDYWEDVLSMQAIFL